MLRWNFKLEIVSQFIDIYVKRILVSVQMLYLHDEKHEICIKQIFTYKWQMSVSQESQEQKQIWTSVEKNKSMFWNPYLHSN